MEWARRCLSHRAHRELRDSLFDFSEDSVISPGTGRQGKCVARGAVAHAFIHSLNWETTPYLKIPAILSPGCLTSLSGTYNEPCPFSKRLEGKT